MRNDKLDVLRRKSCQLQALLHGISGEGLEAFNTLTEDLQGNFLWLACDLIDEIYAALRED
jgi:hypothetical protein